MEERETAGAPRDGATKAAERLRRANARATRVATRAAAVRARHRLADWANGKLDGMRGQVAVRPGGDGGAVAESHYLRRLSAAVQRDVVASYECASADLGEVESAVAPLARRFAKAREELEGARRAAEEARSAARGRGPRESEAGADPGLVSRRMERRAALAAAGSVQRAGELSAEMDGLVSRAYDEGLAFLGERVTVAVLRELQLREELGFRAAAYLRAAGVAADAAWGDPDPLRDAPRRRFLERHGECLRLFGQGADLGKGGVGHEHR